MHTHTVYTHIVHALARTLSRSHSGDNKPSVRSFTCHITAVKDNLTLPQPPDNLTGVVLKNLHLRLERATLNACRSEFPFPALIPRPPPLKTTIRAESRTERAAQV